MSDSPLMVKSKAFGCKPRYGSSPDCDEAEAAHKIGKNWKFKLSEIDEWVKSGMAEEKCNFYKKIVM